MYPSSLRVASPATALVYAGPGAGSRSVGSALHSLRQALRPDIHVGTLEVADLLSGDWQHGCKVLVMPGGADLPYCKHLNGAGTALIRNYVEKGGNYLGLCAGAYFACSRVEFEQQTPIEVVGDRELGFYPGRARGSLYPGFDYESERGAVAAHIRFSRKRSTSTLPGSFSHNAVSQNSWNECKDYFNGGPGFVSQQSESLLGTNCKEIPADVEILASYRDHGGAAAAVACRVGLGTAVLCSTHPELPHQWLELPSGGARSDVVASQVQPGREVLLSTDDVEYMSYVGALIKELKSHEAARWEFWNVLLEAAGMSDCLQWAPNAPVACSLAG